MLAVVILMLVDAGRAHYVTTDSVVRLVGNDSRRSVKDPLLQSLRTQLMQNNYDYEPSARDYSLEKKNVELRANNNDEDDTDNYISREEDRKELPDEDSELSDFSVDRNVLNGYMSELPSASDSEPGVTDAPRDAEETTKDEWIEVIRSHVSAAPYLLGSDTTTQLPYRVLTAHGPSRRSGGVHRYLRAELGDAVLVAPFSPGPMPLFRLPKSRRQYREDSDGDNITGEDGRPS